MLITRPVTYDNTTNGIGIHYDSNTAFCMALDIGTYPWFQAGSVTIEYVIPKHGVILSSSDYVAHDDIIESMYQDTLIVLYLSKHKASSNRLRLKKAQDKLIKSGMRVKYFASRTTAERYITKLKG